MLTGYEIWNCVEGQATKVAAGGRKKVNPGICCISFLPTLLDGIQDSDRY